MKITTKTIMSVSICLSLLIGTQANTQAALASRYGVNAYLAAETAAITTARRAAMNDARYWPATAANDSAFRVAQANTIKSMEKVAKAEAANAASIGLTATDLVQMAGLATMATVGAPVWLTLVVTAGVVGMDIDNYFTMKEILANNANPPTVDYRPVQTPAGVRIKKSISGEFTIPQTGNIFLDPVSFGGIVLRTTNCSLGSACASLPPKPDNVYGYPFSADIEYMAIGSYNFPQAYITTDAIAYFKTIEQANAYISSRFYCSFPAETESGSTVGADCHATLTSTINADYTAFTHTLTQTMVGYRGVQGIPAKIGPHTLSRVSVNTALLDAYAINSGKISLGQSELSAVASPELMAGLLNKLWLKASQQPDYRGLPYSPTNPVTVPQLSSQARPDLSQLLAEVLNPQGDIVLSADGINPDPLVADNPDTTDPNFCQNNPTHSTCRQDQDIDLTAPDATEPALESIPTALRILQPILDLLSPYRNFSVAKPATECPKSSFEALNRTWILDAHCDMFESVRTLLSAVMLSVFAFASFRIVMKA